QYRCAGRRRSRHRVSQRRRSRTYAPGPWTPFEWALWCHVPVHENILDLTEYENVRAEPLACRDSTAEMHRQLSEGNGTAEPHSGEPAVLDFFRIRRARDVPEISDRLEYVGAIVGNAATEAVGLL